MQMANLGLLMGLQQKCLKVEEDFGMTTARTIRDITFVFENCEVITLNGEYIEDFYIKDIRKEYRRIAINAFDKFDMAHYVEISLGKEANIMYAPFNIEADKRAVFDRIMAYNDITSIEFTFEHIEKGVKIIENEEVVVAWLGESEYTNEAQTSHIDNKGTLHLLIDATKKGE